MALIVEARSQRHFREARLAGPELTRCPFETKASHVFTGTHTEASTELVRES